MHAVVRDRLDRLKTPCRDFVVVRLELFGSATSDRFDPDRSDLDFLVAFAPASSGFADRSFGRLDALEALFQRAVDLVETKAITNRYFLEGASRSRELLYAA